MNLVSPSDFWASACELGFEPLSSNQISLPAGKEFVVQVFHLPTANNSFKPTPLRGAA